MHCRKPRSIEKHLSRVFNLSKPKSLHTTYDASESTTSQLESTLKFCSSPSGLRQLKQVHTQFITNGVSNDSLLAPKILGVYVSCDKFNDAKKLFYQLPLYWAMPWNWMIRGLIKTGCFDLALSFYFKMLGCGVSPDKYTFPSVVKACGGLNSVRLGKMVQDTMLSMGFDLDMFVGSSLVKLYAENGCIGYARSLFDKMPHKDSVLWNVMVIGFAKCGETKSAIRAFMDMRSSETKPDSGTFSCVLSVCASEAMVKFGTKLHGLVICCGLELEPLVANTLVAMYSKFGLLGEACKLFSLMPETSSVTWNGMITGYVHNGFMDDALSTFQEMISAHVKPDSTTFASFLPALTELTGVEQGKEIHGYILRHGISLDLFLKSALIDIYFKWRDVEMACKVFEQSSVFDIVMCTAMISGYVLNGMNNSALGIFRWLLGEKMKPNAITLASVLPACADLAALNLGKELHGYALKNDLDRRCYVGSALMDMYAKCGRLDLGYQIFNRISGRDTICWNSMITSCSQNGKPEVAIDLFRQMGNEGVVYNCVTISAVLSACANLPAIHHGKEIHGSMIKSALKSDLFAQSALIDMYAKCGNLNLAQRAFDNMQEKNEVSWNSIVAAYATHGQLENSLAFFHRMLEHGFKPDHVTFISILSACGHAGQVDSGVHYFRYMTEELGIPALMEHYACMVDLFARAGRLDEAFETIKSMPFPPDAGIWGTLLGACRVHGNVEFAEEAARHLLELDPKNSGYYVLLANIHADAGQWGNVLKIRRMMRQQGVRKIPGYSWIEVNNAMHVFVAADGSHPASAQVHSLLNNILPELKREGYVPRPYLPVRRQPPKVTIIPGH